MARSGIDPRPEAAGGAPAFGVGSGLVGHPADRERRAAESKTKSSFASADRCMQPGGTPSARPGGISAAGCGRRAAPSERGRSRRARRDDESDGRPLRGTPAAPARAMRGRRGRAIPDKGAPAQRQCEGRRAPPLYRSHRPRAGDDARASDRSILVPGIRPSDFARRPRSGATRSSSRSGKDTCRPIKAIVDRPAAGRDARSPPPSRTARARARDRRRASPDRRIGQAQLRPLSARHRPADRSRREDGRADADLEVAAVAAGSDRPARRSAGPHPRDQAEARLSQTRDHLEPVHRPQQPERASAEPRSVRANPRQCAKACRPRSARPRACSSAAARQTAATSPIARR